MVMQASKIVLPILLLMGGSALAQAPAARRLGSALQRPQLQRLRRSQLRRLQRLQQRRTRHRWVEHIVALVGCRRRRELAASSITIYPDGRGLPGWAPATPRWARRSLRITARPVTAKATVGGITAAPNLQATSAPDVNAWNRGAGQDGIPTKAPNATIVYDFIHRGMPLGNEGSLTADQYYSLTAYLFAINQIIPQDMVLNQDNLAKVKMPMTATAGVGTGAPANDIVPVDNTYFVAPTWQHPAPGYQRLQGYPY